MRKLLILCLLVVGVSSCGYSSLYYWGGVYDDATRYEHLAYKNYRTQTPESICALICMYEDVVNNPGGVRALPPPGVCAEYGYLLLMPESASVFAKHATAKQKRTFSSSDYSTSFQEKGKEMLQKELDLYPESAMFIGPLVKKLCK